MQKSLTNRQGSTNAFTSSRNIITIKAFNIITNITRKKFDKKIATFHNATISLITLKLSKCKYRITDAYHKARLKAFRCYPISCRYA